MSDTRSVEDLWRVISASLQRFALDPPQFDIDRFGVRDDGLDALTELTNRAEQAEAERIEWVQRAEVAEKRNDALCAENARLLSTNARYRYEHKCYLDEIDRLLKERKDAQSASKTEDFDALVIRAENALTVLARWYCEDTGYKTNRVKTADLADDVANAAYAETIRQEAQE